VSRLVNCAVVADVFLSHAAEDLEQAKQIAAALNEQGLKVWPPNLLWATASPEGVAQFLKLAKCVLVLFRTDDRG
jgi:hypothetical protein